MFKNVAFKVFYIFIICYFIFFYIPAWAQSQPSCTSNAASRSCSTYPTPIASGGSCSPVDQSGILVAGPNQIGTHSYESFYCNSACGASTQFAGYYGGKCNYMGATCPSGQSWQYNGSNFSCVNDECPFGDCESSSSSSSDPVCVPPSYLENGDCVTPDTSSAPSSTGGGSSAGGAASSTSGGDSSSGNGGGDDGGSTPENPVPSDSTCPNKFKIGDQWYCVTDSMPSSSLPPSSSPSSSGGGASSSGDGGGDGGSGDGGSSSPGTGGGGGGGSNNNGEGDSSEASNAAVAGTCGASPVCNGDPVGCAILLNAHLDRCNSDKKTEGGGDCSAEPACSGDPVGCSVALQSWKLRCDTAGEPIDSEVDLGRYDSDFESEFGEGNQASVDSEGALTHLASVSNVVDFNSVDMSGLNINSTGRSSQCPQPRSISLSVGNYQVSYQPLCDLAQGLSTLVVLIFSYIAVRLVWRSTQ